MRTFKIANGLGECEVKADRTVLDINGTLTFYVVKDLPKPDFIVRSFARGSSSAVLNG